MSQEDVRERLIKYVLEKGVRIGHISKKINTPDYVITKFKNYKKDKLWQDSLERLDFFLKSENY